MTILSDKLADQFNKMAKVNAKKKGSIDFTEEYNKAFHILRKAGFTEVPQDELDKLKYPQYKPLI